MRNFSLAALTCFFTLGGWANTPYPLNYHGWWTYECDFCGCATTGGNFGYGTLGNTNFIGLRYSYQQFESKDGIFNDSPTSKEHFNTYQIWAQLPIAPNFHLTATVPFQDLNREFTDRSENISGLGDVSVIGWYTLRFKKKTAATAAETETTMVTMPQFSGHSLRLGLGLKLPTGEFEQVLTDRVNPGFQVGTGSTDAVFSAGYSYSQKMFGVNVTGSYFLKGENKNDYRFGNQLSYNAKVFNGFLVGTHVLAPFVGLSGDFFQKIEQYGDALPETDGYMHLGTVGAEFSINRFVIGADVGLPLGQDLFAGDVKIKQRYLFYLNYTI
ncbi:hypothetical protein [Croceivirga sp. JEA036]|uniref:hypothetical protein n=1 Tax=Croceivirga sp. JEA036 TaxID=2721162 RepID=UPI001FD84C4B|nr:hypothetical protein [Croceivirga sp. JEA036]